jgi:alpha-tubulin suppressor-like RCC1 family protein
VRLEFNGITYTFVANYHGGTGNDLVLQWADVRLLGWGSNSYGQLGNGGTTVGLVPAPVLMSGVLAGKTITSVATGESHRLALCSDGTLAAWGYNSNGQLGNGATNYSGEKAPVLVKRTGVLLGRTVIAIAAGPAVSLALCADGTVAAWGSNSNYQLGDSTPTQSSVPVWVNRTGVLANRPVVAIAAGYSHCLALCADGNVAAWGANDSGQLGNSSTTNSAVPVLVSRAGVLATRQVVAISAGINFSLARCADGSVASWGLNDYGTLGNNTTTRATSPAAKT